MKNDHKVMCDDIFTKINVVSSFELRLEVQPLNAKSFKPCYTRCNLKYYEIMFLSIAKIT